MADVRQARSGGDGGAGNANPERSGIGEEETGGCRIWCRVGVCGRRGRDYRGNRAWDCVDEPWSVSKIFGFTTRLVRTFRKLKKLQSAYVNVQDM